MLVLRGFCASHVFAQGQAVALRVRAFVGGHTVRVLLASGPVGRYLLFRLVV